MTSDNAPGPKVSRIDAVRIGFSVVFIGMGGYFVIAFLLSLGRREHRPYTQLMLGVLVLAYGVWRLLAGRLNYRRMKEMDSKEPKA